MKQQTFAAEDFERYFKQTRREQFLAKIIVPWDGLYDLIEPFYLQPCNGRRPMGLERTRRICLLQHCFNLSDPGAEEALNESRSMCRFVGVDLEREPVLDESTILNFRHLLEQHELVEPLFQAVGEYLHAHGLRIVSGAIIYATIISAPSSTKNKDKAHDPEMHSAHKGNQWYFDMKAHIGVDSKTKQIHTVAATAANVHDSQVLEDLLHGDETRAWGDSAYTGQTDVIRSTAPFAQVFTHKKGRRNYPLDEAAKARNRTKSKVSIRVDHVFDVMKRVFGFTMICYRGLTKKGHDLFVLWALTNPYLARWRLQYLVYDWCA